ncbi:MAG: SDR family oxidoreductase [Desulfarculaceae bacterium]|nr:SDR family oxidoreductase [Desulfarculaceae bacterium]MCF8072926.1 SDR family oxidoreductase [Desulfarculaceae bacterium]MCF8101094.1 SDR family oxidoreductase [Desulfarculaceae bacterium]MCF8115519.1 SDR family oxidoreductase [Desulfarculaceae bacterium]
MTQPKDQLPPLGKPSEMFDLGGRVVLIAGGAGGIGRRMARTLAQAGASVIIADQDQTQCQDLARELAQDTGGKLSGVGLNVTDEAGVSEVFTKVGREQGRLDGLVYNVMAKPEGYYRPFADYSWDAWRQVIEGNLGGAFLCCREAGKLMVPAKQGSVVLTASVYGVVAPDQRIYQGCSPAGNIYGGSDPLSCPAAYTASKGGIIALGRHLASLWGPDGVRVNCLTPGGVFDGQEDAFVQAYNARTPMGRMAEFTDFNGAVLFLLSDASRYLTGTNLVVDGGWTAW